MGIATLARGLMVVLQRLSIAMFEGVFMFCCAPHLYVLSICVHRRCGTRSVTHTQRFVGPRRSKVLG
eukprot:m.25508 g.25508  ORF g.25508 m.25508 type:complete len:67 (+) comp13188_c0_seq1:83-283(+)